ncbi:MAG: biotin--[Clostridia bacterium]|nr:biotin--[acetyl-CoA-carboxylase] ligase [Clostridia bacterium]
MQLMNLNTKFLGRSFSYYEEISSTQTEIWDLIKTNKIENGKLIMANVQTQGKGTHGRTWYTAKNNIAFSFFIETNRNINKLNGITIEIAQILVDIFKEFYNIELNIKEPNDLFYNGKKIGGILTETKISGEIVKYMVVGIGINTSQTNFNTEIKDTATSIKSEFGIEVDRLKIIEEFCNRFERNLSKI